MPASFLRWVDALHACAHVEQHPFDVKTPPARVTEHPHRLLPYRLTYTTDPQHVTTREDRP